MKTEAVRATAQGIRTGFAIILTVLTINAITAPANAYRASGRDATPPPAQTKSNGDYRVCGYTSDDGETMCSDWMSKEKAEAIVAAGDGNLWIEQRSAG